MQTFRNFFSNYEPKRNVYGDCYPEKKSETDSYPAGKNTENIALISRLYRAYHALITR